jgi:hypothetical protein
MAESYNEPLDSFISAAKRIGHLDENSRPTAVGLSVGLYQVDYSIPSRINNYNDDFETYIYFHEETPIIANIRVHDRANFVDAESFAIVSGNGNAEEMMTGNDIVLDIINLVKRDTGQSLMERFNINGQDKEYFQLDLYLRWVKDHFNK